MIRKPGYSVEHESWFIPLTQGVIALVDADMVPILAQHNWYAQKMDTLWYAGRKIYSPAKEIACQMHRFIMSAPANRLVDHEDHYPLSQKLIDNRKANLRLCTNTQNQRNTRPRRGGSSRFKGVHLDKESSKWIARINTDDRQIHLGYFSDEGSAAKAYDTAAREHFGPFRKTNKSLGLLSETITEVKDDE